MFGESCASSRRRGTAALWDLRCSIGGTAIAVAPRRQGEPSVEVI